MMGGKRTPIACNPCRKSKRKCNGERPQCAECKRHGRPCVFLAERSIKRASNRNHVRMLEDQIRTLTALAANRRASVGRSISPDGGLGDVQHTPSSVSIVAQALSRQVSQLATDITGAPILIGAKSVFALSDSPIVPRGEFAALQHNGDAGVKSFSRCLHDMVLVEHLTDCFLKHINVFYQFTKRDHLPRPLPLSTCSLDKQVYFLALLSLGSCYSSQREAREIGMGLFLYAEQLVLPCCRQRPTLYLVRGLAIMALQGMSLGDKGAGWIHLKMAAGLIEQLGLLSHHDQVSSQAPNLAMDTFRSFYFVNRLAITILGRSAIDTVQHYAQPPEDILSLDQLLFIRTCQLWCISDIYREKTTSCEFLLLPTHKREQTLIEARSHFVEFYSSNSTLLTLNHTASSYRPALIFQIAYQVALQFIYRPFLCHPTEPIARLAQESVISAAIAISHLVRQYRKTHSFADAPPFVIFHLLQTIFGHLLAASTLTGRRHPLMPLAQCLLALEEMRPTWSTQVQQAVRLVCELASRWMVTWALPMRYSHPCIVPRT